MELYIGIFLFCFSILWFFNFPIRFLDNVNFLTADGLKFTHPLHHLGKSASDLPVISIDSFKHMYVFPYNVKEHIEYVIAKSVEFNLLVLILQIAWEREYFVQFCTCTILQ